MREAKANGEMNEIEIEEAPEEETPFWLRGFGTKEWKRRYKLKNPDWNFDAVPEIMDGHNIADFIDPEILNRLEELEREEEELLKNAENQMDEVICSLSNFNSFFNRMNGNWMKNKQQLSKRSNKRNCR